MNEPTVPLDIRLMNGLAGLLLVVAVLAVVGGLLGWAMRLPVFAIHGVTVTGDVTHYNAITLRANVMPRLQGTFFTLDVHAARKAFEGMPWVRNAVVRRDFPDRLRVQLQEHQAVAFWGADDLGGFPSWLAYCRVYCGRACLRWATLTASVGSGRCGPRCWRRMARMGSSRPMRMLRNVSSRCRDHRPTSWGR